MGVKVRRRGYAVSREKHGPTREDSDEIPLRATATAPVKREKLQKSRLGFAKIEASSVASTNMHIAMMKMI